MSWRVVVISTHCKLECRLNYLVIRSQEVTTRIFLDEISTLIVETTAVSLTSALLCELTKRKIKVVFCDEKRNPQSELIPYYGCHDTVRKLQSQIAWNPAFANIVWTHIVQEKISKQATILKLFEKSEFIMLEKYAQDIQIADTTNREGHAAKVYFNALFGLQFSRNEDNAINAALNYGYAIILSAFNREIVNNGYSTILGIGHNNIFNCFNLTCDLMEPFRILIDKTVFEKNETEFNIIYKHELVDILNKEVQIAKEKTSVNNAIRIYTKSFFDTMENQDVSLLKFYEL